MRDDFQILIDKLNAFKRKFYTNRLLKGSLLFLTSIILLFLFIDFIEYFAWMGKGGRRAVFFLFSAVSIFLLIYWIILPLLKLFHIGHTISYEEASRIIGKHFPEVDDKLLNALQLKEYEKSVSAEEKDLLNASIAQKTDLLKPVHFVRAVNLKQNLKYLRFLLPAVILILFLITVFPSFITEPSKRIVHFDKHFVKPLPYSVKLLNKKLQVVQHDDFTLQVAISGDEIPEGVYVKNERFSYRMYPVKQGVYEYTFKDINKSFEFEIHAGEFISEIYKLTVIPKPVIYSFDVVLRYPAYLKMKERLIEGLGDLVVPEATEILWRLHTKDVNHVYFLTNDSTIKAKQVNENTFIVTQKAFYSFNYGLVAANKNINGMDTLNYSVQIIKDEYPKILVESYQSTEFAGFVQLSGVISDDYGFHSLKLYYKQDIQQVTKWKEIDLEIDKEIKEQRFGYSFQLLEMGLTPGQGLNYFFEVRDNDAVHGFKATKSITGYLHLPDPDEVEGAIDSTSSTVKENLERQIKDLEQLNDQMEQFRMELFNKKKLNWSDKQKLSEMLNKEKELQKKIDKLNELNKEIRNLEEMIKKKTDPELLERLQELQKMFEKLKNEELQKELDKLQKELEKMDKNKLSELLDKMKKQNETLKENLEQSLELFKQMEIEKKVQDLAEKLKNLSKKQEALSEKTAQKELDKKEALEKQQKLKKDFKKLEQEIDQINKLDKELQEPFNLKKDTATINKVQDQMQQAEQKLQKNKQKKAAENQKKAAKQMNQMAENMLNMMSQAMKQRTGEDMEMIRRLLDNLVDLSYRQENLMNQITALSTKDPKFVTSAETLRNLKDEFNIIQDSLKAIGKRQVYIQPFIIRETETVEYNMKSAISEMQERRKGQSLSKQQYAMTHVNNLALMLDEALNKMKNSMSSKGGKGNKACPNPGKGSKPSLNNLMKMQESLSEGLKKIAQKKGEGKGKKKGKNQGDGPAGNSAELARLAALQYEIRQRLQEYLDELKSNGGNGKALNDALKEMEKTEQDIVNKKITQETLERQRKIKVRLLKAKNAEMEREKEEKRESKEGKNRHRRNLNKKLKYKKDKSSQEGIIILKPLELNHYFNTIYKNYLYQIDLEYEGVRK